MVTFGAERVKKTFGRELILYPTYIVCYHTSQNLTWKLAGIHSISPDKLDCIPNPERDLAAYFVQLTSHSPGATTPIFLMILPLHMAQCRDIITSCDIFLISQVI